MPENMNGQLLIAAFLIQLGITTVEKVMDVFKSDGHDDEALIEMQADLERRIARRS